MWLHRALRRRNLDEEFVYSSNLKLIRKRYPKIHPSVAIGFRTNIYGDGEIIIGEESRIGNGCILETDKGTSITIGKRVLISHNVAIYTSNACSDQDFSKRPLKMRFGDVSIGDYCWICYGVFIREGVNIGERCVIGANSVVLEDIPPNTMAAGVPTKPKKSIS